MIPPAREKAPASAGWPGFFPRKKAPASAGRPAPGPRRPPVGRMGVLGGTFDPIHLGHLRAAEELADLLELDRVMFVPAARNPLRKGAAGAPPEERLQMARLAVEGNPRFVVADLEVRRGGASFTFDTLEELARRLPDTPLVLAMGLDAWRDFGSWKNPGSIASLADIAVMARPGSAASEPAADLLASLPVPLRGSFRGGGDGSFLHASGRRLIPAAVTALDVSASRLREMASSGRSLRYLVPDAVLAYIAERGLYRGGNGGRP